MSDFEVHLADDVQPVRQHEVVVAVDAPAEGVFEGKHRAVRRELLRGLIRFDSIRCDAMRCDAMRCDSIRFDSIRFDSIRRSIDRRRGG